MIPFVSQIKTYIYGGALAVIAISILLALRTWHYAPIDKLKTENKSLQSQLFETGRILNICEANLSKQKLQGFIDGVGGNNEDPVIDFGNITY